MTRPPSPDDRRHPFVRLVAQMTYDHRHGDYSDGDAPVRITVPGLFTNVEGMASTGADGLIDFRPYTYTRPATYAREDRGAVTGVEDFPYHLHPDHVVAIRPADDLPPS